MVQGMDGKRFQSKELVALDGAREREDSAMAQWTPGQVAMILLPKRLEQGYTHVRLISSSDCDDGCREAIDSPWTIGRYDHHLTRNPDCKRRVGGWIKRGKSKKDRLRSVVSRLSNPRR